MPCLLLEMHFLLKIKPWWIAIYFCRLTYARCLCVKEDVQLFQGSGHLGKWRDWEYRGWGGVLWSTVSKHGIAMHSCTLAVVPAADLYQTGPHHSMVGGWRACEASPLLRDCGLLMVSKQGDTDRSPCRLHSQQRNSTNEVRLKLCLAWHHWFKLPESDWYQAVYFNHI